MGIRAGNLLDLMSRLNGRWVFRSLVTAASGTPKDNLNTPGTQYTLKGGETLLLQSDIDAYVQIINDATTAMTASGAKAITLAAGPPGVIVCLFGDDVRVCVDCASGTANVKVFELR